MIGMTFEGKPYRRIVMLAAVLAGSAWAGNPPAGKTVLWDEASKTLRITYANADGALGGDFWITNRVYDATSLEPIAELDMATKKVERFVVDITNATLRAWFHCTQAAPFEANAPVFDIVNGTVDVCVTDHMSTGSYSFNYNRPNTIVHVRENAMMKFHNVEGGVCNYLYIGTGELVLHGGRVVQPWLTTVAGSSPVFETRDAAQNDNALHVMGVIRAAASPQASVISARRLTLDTYCTRYPVVFDVEEGAVLELDAELVDTSRGGKASPSGFVKRGKGRLVLKRPSSMTGAISVEEGTLALAEGASLENLALLEVYSAAQVELAPGVPPIRAPRLNVPAAVRKAVVRVDATRCWGNGSGSAWDYNGLYNLGTAGGAFSRSYDYNPLTFSPGLFRGPEWPAFRMNWVDYTLTGFSNPSRALTLLYSMRHVTTTGRDAWKGVYSIYNGAAKTADPDLDWNKNNAVATFRLEMPDGNSAATGYDARYIQYRGSWTDTGLTNDRARPYDEAYVDCLVLSNVTASSQKFVWEQHFTNDVQRKEITLNYAGALNHDTFRLGTRPRDRASCAYQAFGELMMFCGDALTPQELADVKTYLKTKWLGAHVPNAGDGAEAVTEIDVPAGSVEVAHGSSTRAVKRGAGTLELNSVRDAAADLSVEAGTLAFASKAVAPKVQVWADIGDGSSLTTNTSGQVLSIRNKGALGGAFRQTSKDSGNYGRLVSSGTDRPNVMRCSYSTYDFLDDRMMPSDKDNLTAIVVFKPQSASSWIDMFALIPGTDVMQDETKMLAPVFYFETCTSPFYVVYKNESGTSIVNTGISAANSHSLADLKDTFSILGAELAPERQVLYFAETETDDDVNKVGLRTASGDCTRRFGGVRLGGRPNERVTSASWWDGDIAEALVFNTNLNDAERQSVMDYLRAKWYRGEAVEAPAVLVGAPAPARMSGGALTLADGVTVKIDGETVGVDRLTVPAGATITLDPGALDKAVDDGRELFEFTAGTVDGTFVLPSNLRSTWKVKVREGIVSLAYNSGFAVILR